MLKRSLLVIMGASTILFCAGLSSMRAETPASAALTGQVSSKEEGPLEGVLVGAKKAGSNITITVVSDQQGRYQFPASKLEPGQYSLRIRAVGYDLEGPAAVQIAPQKTTTADLKLRKTNDLAAQLSNWEWLASFPGTDQQKASVRGCTHCHTLERVAKSRHDAAEFEKVVERMSEYPPLSFPLLPQKRLVQRHGGGEDLPPTPEQKEARRRQTEYLASINLSSSPEWKYSFKTAPRPTGKATRVIITEYDLAKPTRQPHDVILDANGMAWYNSFGEEVLGKLDPKTGKVTDYDLPVQKPEQPKGGLAVRSDKEGNVWFAMGFQGAIGKVDRKTGKIQVIHIPPELNKEYTEITEVAPQHSDVDGKVWILDAGTYTFWRMDIASGKFEVFEPFPMPRPNIYDTIPDAQNNLYFTVFGGEQIGRVDAKSGKISLYKTPTPRSGPRRGMMDSEGRVWFSENRADRIGMFDTKTEKFQEWTPPMPGYAPYSIAADKNGEAWVTTEFTDQVLRLDPKTGQFTVYLLPRHTNMRSAFVDNSTTPVTFWVGNNHGASIVKLEPLE